MDDKEFRAQRDNDIPNRSYKPYKRGEDDPNRVMWQVAGGVIIAAVTMGVGNAIYEEYQARKAARMIAVMVNEFTENLDRQLSKPLMIQKPTETWQERQIRGEKTQQEYKTSQKNLERCQFWMMQEPSERQEQEMARYCR